jgi:hypothetical protein
MKTTMTINRKARKSEIAKLSKLIATFDHPTDENDTLPSGNGIDRIVFQARFIRRALKQDPVGLAAIIEATRASMLANLKNRPELLTHKAVKAVMG